MGQPEDPRRVIMADVALESARAGGDPDQAERLGVVDRDGARRLEASLHGGRVPQQLHRGPDVPRRRVEPLHHLRRERGVHVEGDPARPHQIAPEAVAADRGGEVQEVAAQPPAMGRGRKERDVVRQGTEPSGVVTASSTFTVSDTWLASRVIEAPRLSHRSLR